MSVPTNNQLYLAIAALSRSFTLPSVNGNQTGVSKGNSNQLRIPCSSVSPQGLYNQQLATQVAVSVSLDGDYVEIAHNVGDAN